MITGTVWGITLIVLGFLLSLGATKLLAFVAFPRLVERTATLAARSGRGLVFNVLRGSAAAALVIGFFAGFANGGPGAKVFTFVPFLAGMVFLVCGLAGVSLAVGRRLPSPADEGRAWRQLVRGAITTEIAYVVPFIGWFILTAVTAVIGLGAVSGALLPERAGAPSPDDRRADGLRADDLRANDSGAAAEPASATAASEPVEPAVVGA